MRINSSEVNVLNEKAIIQALDKRGVDGATRQEIADELGGYTHCGCWRFAELIESGKIVEYDEFKRKNPSGQWAKIMVLNKYSLDAYYHLLRKQKKEEAEREAKRPNPKKKRNKPAEDQ